MIRKDVFIAVLVILCLTTTLFIVLPTRSSPNAVPEYDSWADINGDGKINMYDIGYTARLYGATGDPTKNVNVTNWPESRMILYGTYNLSWGLNNTGRVELLSGGEMLSVEDCSSISVFLHFENTHVEVGEEWAMWYAEAYWFAENTSDWLLSAHALPFTVTTVDYVDGPVGIFSPRAPYVSFVPRLMNIHDCTNYSNEFQAIHNATSVCKIYVYLSHYEETLSDRSMNAQHLFVVHRAATSKEMYFGGYMVEGYSEICLQLVSNVSCTVRIDDGAGATGLTYDLFSLSADVSVQRNYEVQSSRIQIMIQSGPVPRETTLRAYIKP